MARWGRRNAQWYEPTTPRKVEGGIKARNARGAFAATWWGKEWIRILESQDVGARLSRGKSYARKGQVTDLEITPGQITAKVQGSRSGKYLVSMRCSQLSEEQKETLLETLEEQPLLTARLLDNELPEEMTALFQKTGCPLFPSLGKDLETGCSCPDWSSPCKHMAAVFYLVAEALDNNPLLLLTLRGLPQEELFAELNPLYREDEEAESPRPLPPEQEGFWGKSSALPPREEPLPPPELHGALPRRLGPLPFWRSATPLLPLMQKLYKAASRNGDE